MLEHAAHVAETLAVIGATVYGLYRLSIARRRLLNAIDLMLVDLDRIKSRINEINSDWGGGLRPPNTKRLEPFPFPSPGLDIALSTGLIQKFPPDTQKKITQLLSNLKIFDTTVNHSKGPETPYGGNVHKSILGLHNSLIKYKRKKETWRAYAVSSLREWFPAIVNNPSA